MHFCIHQIHIDYLIPNIAMQRVPSFMTLSKLHSSIICVNVYYAIDIFAALSVRNPAMTDLHLKARPFKLENAKPWDDKDSLAMAWSLGPWSTT